MAQHFAAVGGTNNTPGAQGIVWGLGDSPEAARADAAQWLDVHEITAKQAERIGQGEIKWAELQSSQREGK
jgi:hypothetical protein